MKHGIRAIVILLLVVSSHGLGQQPEDLSVLAVKDRHKILTDYLLVECQKHFDARRKAVDAIKTPEEFFERQKQLRKDWVEALGGFPERTPLNPRVI